MLSREPAPLGIPLGDALRGDGIELDWLNKGVFVSVCGRRPGGVVYETYLVG